MTTFMGNRNSFMETDGSVLFRNRFQPAHNPLVMIGIQRDLTRPFFYGHNLFHRMRVIVVEPEEAARWDAEDAEGDDATELLPMLPRTLTNSAQRSLQARLVQGEILQDDQGNYFERMGSRIRPLRRLASGPRGEIVDVNPSIEAKQAGNPNLHEQASPKTIGPRRGRDVGEHNTTLAAAPETNPADVPTVSTASSWQRLIPEPGPIRIVAFGEFKEMLAPQLAHPERLRASHRLPCYVQAFAVQKPQPVEALALAILGDGEKARWLGRLSEGIAARLQLGELVPGPGGATQPHQRTSGIVQPADRVFHLRPVSDPTSEDPADSNRPENSHPGSGGDPSRVPNAVGEMSEPGRATLNGARWNTDTPVRNEANDARTGESAMRQSLERTPPSGLKNAIPDRYARPWEFQISREEAFYDMKQVRTWSDRLGAFLGRHWSHADFRKWQTLLSGKSPEDQLWGIRPPKEALKDPAMREWAHDTLQLAGYDPRTMLMEWEVFWRRKGLR